MLSEITLINYSTMLWVYLGIRLFLSLAFIIGIIYFGARLKRKTMTAAMPPQKSKFVSLGIGWSPRKEERRITAERRGKQTVYIAGMSLILGVAIGYGGIRIKDAYFPSKLEEVLILATNADGSHVVFDKYSRQFSVKWCSGPDDLIPGNKLPAVYYRQQFGCKQIRGMFLGYSVYSYKDGTRMVFPIPKENADAR